MDKLDEKALEAAVAPLVLSFFRGKMPAGCERAVADIRDRLTKETETTIRAYLSHLPPAERAGAESVPAGWKLVPIVETPEMIDAATKRGQAPDDSLYGSVYRAMLSAAPPAPLAPQGEGAAIKTRSNSDVAPLDAAAVRESALRECAKVAEAHAARCLVQAEICAPPFVAEWTAEGRRAEMIANEILALIAPAAPGEGEGRDHG